MAKDYFKANAIAYDEFNVASDAEKRKEMMEKSGQLLEARSRYISSQAFWETKDAIQAIKHIEEEIHNRVKDALRQAHKLYEQGQFKPAAEALENALKLGEATAILSYDLALCYERTGDKAASLAYLDQAASASELNIPGMHLHALKGERKGWWAMTVSGNYRITFRFDGEDAIDLDLEDYH